MKRDVRKTRGAVYVELLIVLVPLLIFILALVQTALMYVGKLAVQRAANTAARAAVVVLDDDPRYYNGAPRNSVSGGGSRAVDPVSAFVMWMGMPPAPPFGSDSARLQDIRAAASIPLISVSPNLSSLVGYRSVMNAIGAGDTDRLGADAALFTRGAVAVTFPTAPGSSTYRTEFGRNDDVTVRVTYAYHCGVPLVRYLMCESVPSIHSGVSLDAVYDLANIASWSTSTPSDIARAVERVQMRSNRIGRWHTNELSAAEAPWLLDITALTGARYFIMSAEATLPNQGARYSYEGGP